MALVPIRSDLKIWDPFEFEDRLRFWRDLEYFDSLLPFTSPLYPARLSRWFRSKSLSNLNFSNEFISKEGFKVEIDVGRFKPHEIEVRIVDDIIVVEGKQEERWDNHKTTTRHFENSYALPIGYDPWLVSSTLSKSGILIVTAPRPRKGPAKCTRRYVPIKQL